MGELQIGDWVVVRDEDAEETYLGYVLRIDADEDDGGFQLAYRFDSTMGWTKDWFDIDIPWQHVKPDLIKEDIICLMHLAVDIGDKEWFMELGERLKRGTTEVVILFDDGEIAGVFTLDYVIDFDLLGDDIEYE